MRTLVTEQMLVQLEASVQSHLARAKEIVELPIDLLRARPAAKKWSVLEIFEHMNLSSGHYYRALRKAMLEGEATGPASVTFRPGIIGAYSVRSMLPRVDGSIPMPMRTLPMFKPNADRTGDRQCVQDYMKMQEGWLTLMDQARNVDLNAFKIRSTLGPIIRFKAGDAFRFPIAHDERHFMQLERTLSSVSGMVDPR